MSRLLVHIGIPKTATSTIQARFARDRILEPLGIVYPDHGLPTEGVAHHLIYRSVREGDGAPAARALTAAVGADRDTLISSEAFTNLLVGRPGHTEPLTRFLTALTDIGWDVNVVAFIREATSFFESMYLQSVKTGTVVDPFDDYVAVRRGSYENLFRNLAALDVHTTVKAFQPATYGADWQDILGAADPVDTTEKANTRPSLKTLAMFLGYDRVGVDLGRADALRRLIGDAAPFTDDTAEFTLWAPDAAAEVAADALVAAERHGFSCYTDAFAGCPGPSGPTVVLTPDLLTTEDWAAAAEVLSRPPDILPLPEEGTPVITPAVIKPAHPIGHFYSPVVNPEEVAEYADRLWPATPPVIHGIDFNDEHHRHVLETLYPKFYADYDYPEYGVDDSDLQGYYTRNGQFGWLDGRTLFVLLRAWRPKRLVEVGSGYSTLLASDVNKRFLDGTCQIDAIEPYPRPFLHNPSFGVRLIEKKVQDVPLEEFEGLEPGDVVFIDSSHVCKTGSDVQFLYFEVLPRLRAGVRIHIHDIFLPLEYPKEWVLDANRSWNEQYLLRALLMDSTAYRVLFGCTYAVATFPDLVGKALGRDPTYAGASLWLEKV